MSEVFITYQVTISEEELDIITAMVAYYKEDNPENSWTEDCGEAIINGILQQIVNPNKE